MDVMPQAFQRLLCAMVASWMEGWMDETMKHGNHFELNIEITQSNRKYPRILIETHWTVNEEIFLVPEWQLKSTTCILYAFEMFILIQGIVIRNYAKCCFYVSLLIDPYLWSVCQSFGSSQLILNIVIAVTITPAAIISITFQFIISKSSHLAIDSVSIASPLSIVRMFLRRWLLF